MIHKMIGVQAESKLVHRKRHTAEYKSVCTQARCRSVCTAANKVGHTDHKNSQELHKMVVVVELHKMVVELHKMVAVAELHKTFEPSLELQDIHTMELELLHSHRMELQALLNTHRMELQALLNTHRMELRRMELQHNHKMELELLLHSHKMELQAHHKKEAHHKMELQHKHLQEEHTHLLAQQEPLPWAHQLLALEVLHHLAWLQLGQLACHLVWAPVCQGVLMGLFERRQWPRPQKTEQAGKSLWRSIQ